MLRGCVGGGGWRGVVQLPSWDEGVCDGGCLEGETRGGRGGHGGVLVGGVLRWSGRMVWGSWGSWLCAIWVSGARGGCESKAFLIVLAGGWGLKFLLEGGGDVGSLLVRSFIHSACQGGWGISLPEYRVSK